MACMYMDVAIVQDFRKEDDTDETIALNDLQSAVFKQAKISARPASPAPCARSWTKSPRSALR